MKTKIVKANAELNQHYKVKLTHLLQDGGVAAEVELGISRYPPPPSKKLIARAFLLLYDEKN